MTESYPAIRCRHLWHRYGPKEVLHDVCFDVNRGEIFGFIGPNGAGKTTTIRIMSTLLEPMAGRVEIEGPRGTNMILRKGLEAGELVVTEGIQRVRPGQVVSATEVKPGA